MAAPPSLCRLCVTTSNDGFKSLYDEHGQANDLYKITYDYFHSKIVDLEKAKHLTTICLQCFRHIHEFHSFQTSVIVAQLKLTEEDKKILEEIETPQPEILTQTTMAIKIEDEEFIRYTPEYVIEKDCPQIMQKELLTLPDMQIEDYFPSKSEKYIRHDTNEEEDRKDYISLPPLEITDVDTSSTRTSDDELSLSQQGARKTYFLRVRKNRSPDGVDQTQTIDNDDQPQKKPETLEKLLTKWIPNIKCFKCTMSFPSWLLFRHHFRRQHPKQKFYYICCSREFTSTFIREHLLLHEDPNAFKCSICGVRYNTNHSLLSHYNSRHPENLKFPCNKCNKRCYSKVGLANHQFKVHSSYREDLSDLKVSTQPTNEDQMETSERLYTLDYLLDKWIPNIKCFECKMTFPSWLLFRRHFRRQHPNQKLYYICCSRKFTSSFIREHLLLHEDPDAFKCSICGVRYNTNHSLLFHYNLRHPENLKFPCDKCNKRCYSKVGLANHQIKVHSSDRQHLPDLEVSTQPTNEGQMETSERLYTLDYLLDKWIPHIKCFECNKSFPFWSLVKDHFKQQHPNEKFYYKCCSRTFNQNTIKDHLLLHSDPDAFKCLICGKSYTSKLTLLNHKTEMHTESCKFSCDKCGRRFRSKQGVICHMRKTHRRNRQDHAQVQLLADGRTAYNCLLCGETKYSITEFRLHKSRMHKENNSKVVCTVCGKICLNARAFREHMASHKNKKLYKCAFCPRTYGTIAAVRFHRSGKHPLESNENCYINNDEITNDQSEDSSRDSESTSPKSTSAVLTEKEVGDDFTDDLEDSKDTINTDHSTMTKLNTDEVNTAWETNASLAAFKNEDFGEECASTTSMATTADKIDNKSKKSSARAQPNIRLPPKRGKRSLFGSQRK